MKTFRKKIREDQKGMSPLSIYIRAKKAKIAVIVLAQATNVTESPDFRPIYEMGNVSSSMPPTTS